MEEVYSLVMASQLGEIMEENNIDLVALRKNIAIVEQDGKDIVLNDKADKALAMLKYYEAHIDIAIKAIKAIMPEVLEPFNAKTVRGKYVTLSIGKPRGTSTYYVDEEGAEYTKQQITNVVDVAKIEAYIDEHGHLPVGVHKNEPKPVVSIRAKDVENE